jgi:hypothetical protein
MNDPTAADNLYVASTRAALSPMSSSWTTPVL